LKKLNSSTEVHCLPRVIQGGMGFNISIWPLARIVSMLGQLGTVSGVGADILLARLLQEGDLGGHLRRALATFPFQNMAKGVLDEYFVEGGIPAGAKYKGKPVFTVKPPARLIALTICANYAFVYLAKEGHSNPVSINYMAKISMSLMCGILGAMMAGVDFVTVGAGIPRQIPDVIDAIAEGRVVHYDVDYAGIDGKTKKYAMSFDPKKFFGSELPPMKKPGFIPIVASTALAILFATKIEGDIAALVVEGPTAGGHNAPPRTPAINADGEQILVYGEKDVVDYAKLVALGVRFYIGGSCASPERLRWALSVGAMGIQVGSMFAFSDDSGMDPEIRREVRRQGYNGTLKVRTDMDISPTGYPFQVVELEGTIADPEVFRKRDRVCNQCALVSLYEKPDGSIGYRCAAEPEKKYTAKGGKLEDTVGRGCLCNGLMVTARLGNKGEPAVVTAGNLDFLPFLMDGPNDSYGAKQAIEYLLGNTV